jgi:N-acetylmuramoyl-L-alanine amidase
MKKRIWSLLLFLAVLFCSFNFNALNAYAANKNIVVVIDPGHGGNEGTNLGAVYNGFMEKELTLKVANAMKAELEKYDNVTVYMTRTTDQFMSLEDRAVYAKQMGADFVFSIHFNASAEHNFFGSEVWCSGFGDYYKKGYEFGLLEQNELGNLGLYQKGVKTKIGTKGDYYGIIRQCVARGIPCDIIEHCYLDHGYDLQYLNGQDFTTTLGKADATAVAKYYKLKSKDGKTDYFGLKNTSVKKPSGTVYQDTTDPDVCKIQVLAYDSASRNALVELTAKDSQSPIIYFAYSYDGGTTFSTLGMWDRTKDTQSFNVKIPNGRQSANLVVRAFNSFELFKDSNGVAIETR